MTSRDSANPYSLAVQDYLRAIYQLSLYDSGDNPVTTSQLAQRLEVRPASVTSMLRKMAAAAPALVDYHKSHGARLTDAGEQAALRVVRCHRLLESFLHEKLGYGWDEVHIEADRLEHVVSGAMAERMAEALGHPTRDPHGHAIPTADLAIDQAAAIPLGDILQGEAAVVQYVRDEDPEFLRYLDVIGLRPGVAVVATRRDATGQLLWLRVGTREPVALNLATAGRVFISYPVA